VNTSIVLPAEWHAQSAVQLTWPDEQTDWAGILDSVIPCFLHIAREVAKRQQLVIVCRDKAKLQKQLTNINIANVIICETELNDTWARDHGGITVFENEKPVVYDFRFNGWGLKFPACYDNLITSKLYQQKIFNSNVKYSNQLQFVLEGGGIESDGEGTLLTTSECLLSPNRNGHLNQQQIEENLIQLFGAKRVLWVNNGYLEGDDTDSHIDTLARFCNPQTIAYVQCTDKSDVHFSALQAMEAELKAFTDFSGKPYRLIPLPMASAQFDESGNRLPATYANFLIINGAVLLPIYHCETDSAAIEAISKAFPEHEIVPINCSALIRQHGSLHCVTMQYPKGVIETAVND
jgi:agmatine/peptidylarginine deiminase